jgi:hypothetical protein
MGKKDRTDGSEVSFSDADREKAKERLYEEIVKSKFSTAIKEDKKVLVDVLRDWLRG